MTAKEAPHLGRGTTGPGDLHSLGAAVIARLDEELYLLALCQAAEALGDNAGLHTPAQSGATCAEGGRRDRVLVLFTIRNLGIWHAR